MKVTITCYWTPELDNEDSWKGYARPDDPESMDVHGIKFPPAFLRAVAMEGCGVGNGKTVTYEGGAWEFIDEVKFPMGIDAMGTSLAPYRTIAVDPHQFKMGKKYHICDLLGRQMPSGIFHDGIVLARDVGGGIGTGHIDFYVGTKAEWLEIDRWLPAEVNIEELA